MHGFRIVFTTDNNILLSLFEQIVLFVRQFYFPKKSTYNYLTNQTKNYYT